MTTETERVEPEPEPEADSQTLPQSADAPPVMRSRKVRLILAFVVAAISDTASVFAQAVPPVEWMVDLVTAILLFLLLGRNWLLLPGLIAEATPGIAMFPTWVLVVSSIAVWGGIRGPVKRAG